jgi:hypothetical protein
MRLRIAETKAWAEKLLLHVEDCVMPLSDAKDDAINKILDVREGNPFDGERLKLHNLRENAKSGLNQTAATELKALSEASLEECYRIVISNSHAPGLAAYISDDIELILECLALGVKNEFLCSLINSYAKGKIPGNGMENTNVLPPSINWL